MLGRLVQACLKSHGDRLGQPSSGAMRSSSCMAGRGDLFGRKNNSNKGLALCCGSRSGAEKRVRSMWSKTGFYSPGGCIRAFGWLTRRLSQTRQAGVLERFITVADGCLNSRHILSMACGSVGVDRPADQLAELRSARPGASAGEILRTSAQIGAKFAYIPGSNLLTALLELRHPLHAGKTLCPSHPAPSN